MSYKMLIFKAFHPLPTAAVLFACWKCVSHTRCDAENCDILNSFTWNRRLQFHNRISFSQGIDSVDLMPADLKNFLIRAQGSKIYAVKGTRHCYEPSHFLSFPFFNVSFSFSCRFLVASSFLVAPLFSYYFLIIFLAFPRLTL